MSYNEKRAKKLETVRGLLAKAEDKGVTPAEADAFRAKASKLMLEFSIEQWQVQAAQRDADAPTEPESRRFDLSWYTKDNGQSVWNLMQVIGMHCRVKLVYWVFDGEKIPAVGMPSDLDYFDMLFTHLMVQLANGLEPKPDPDKSMIENLVVMKEAGMKWERIGELLIGVGQLDHYNRNVGVRFTKLYTDYCAEHKRERLRVSPSVYQRSFARGFVATLQQRLRSQEDAYKGTGMELAVRDISGKMHEEARKKFGMEPNRRGSVSRKKVDTGAYRQGVGAGERASVVASHGQAGLANRKQIGG